MINEMCKALLYIAFSIGSLMGVNVDNTAYAQQPPPLQDELPPKLVISQNTTAEEKRKLALEHLLTKEWGWWTWERVEKLSGRFLDINNYKSFDQGEGLWIINGGKSQRDRLGYPILIKNTEIDIIRNEGVFYCSSNQRGNGSKAFFETPQSFANMMYLRELSLRVPEKKFVLDIPYSFGETIQRIYFNIDDMERRGIYFLKDDKIIDYTPGLENSHAPIDPNKVGNISIYHGNNRNLGFVHREKYASRLEFWVRNIDQYRFSGDTVLHKVEKRKMSVQLPTKNSLFQRIQDELMMGGDYDNAKRALASDLDEKNDRAIALMLKGVLYVHENLDAWRNNGRAINIDKMLTDAEDVYFRSAVLIDNELRSVINSFLSDEGVILYRGKLLQEQFPQPKTIEQALRNYYGYILDKDKPNLETIEKLADSESRRFGGTTHGHQPRDFDIVSTRLCDATVVFAWRYKDISSVFLPDDPDVKKICVEIHRAIRPRDPNSHSRETQRYAFTEEKDDTIILLPEERFVVGVSNK